MSSADHPLDNVVWSALTSSHAAFATGRGLARHYPRDMAPFSAIAEPTARAYADLADSLDTGVEARLFRPREEPAPPGWETMSARPILQMLAERSPPDAALREDHAVIPLTDADAAAMHVLAEAAKPGPFSDRTILLGNYVGIRDPASGDLIAMAGERFRFPGHVELSAICVHPHARGRGLGRILTRHLMQAALTGGATPFLHVFPDNPAVRLYAQCGFRIRAQHWVIWRRPPR